MNQPRFKSFEKLCIRAPHHKEPSQLSLTASLYSRWFTQLTMPIVNCRVYLNIRLEWNIFSIGLSKQHVKDLILTKKIVVFFIDPKIIQPSDPCKRFLCMDWYTYKPWKKIGSLIGSRFFINIIAKIGRRAPLYFYRNYMLSSCIQWAHESFRATRYTKY